MKIFIKQFYTNRQEESKINSFQAEICLLSSFTKIQFDFAIVHFNEQWTYVPSVKTAKFNTDSKAPLLIAQ